jgi:hypothetical protein
MRRPVFASCRDAYTSHFPSGDTIGRNLPPYSEVSLSISPVSRLKLIT